LRRRVSKLGGAVEMLSTVEGLAVAGDMVVALAD
jgi:hypothetical protein